MAGIDITNTELRMIREAARDSAVRLRAVFDTVSDLFFEQDSSLELSGSGKVQYSAAMGEESWYSGKFREARLEGKAECARVPLIDLVTGLRTQRLILRSKGKFSAGEKVRQANMNGAGSGKGIVRRSSAGQEVLVSVYEGEFTPNAVVMIGLDGAQRNVGQPLHVENPSRFEPGTFDESSSGGFVVSGNIVAGGNKLVVKGRAHQMIELLEDLAAMLDRAIESARDERWRAAEADSSTSHNHEKNGPEYRRGKLVGELLRPLWRILRDDRFLLVLGMIGNGPDTINGEELHKLARGMRFSRYLTALHGNGILQIPIDLNSMLSYASAAQEAAFMEDIRIMKWIIVNSS
jgi:hypothetical protein